MTRQQRERVRLRSRIRELEADAQIHKVARDRLAKERDEAALKDKDRLVAINAKDEAIRILNERLFESRAERDRMFRMVDQFTSISIGNLSDAASFLRGKKA